MLKELIEGTFFLTFSKKEHVMVNIVEDTFLGEFSLHDPNACRSCKICLSDQSQKNNIKISTLSPIFVVSVNQILSYIKDRIGRSCDYLIANKKTVCFMEMTCSTSKNVNRYDSGKRMTAKAQISNTISIFRSNPNVKEFIEKKERRLAVFSWKETLYTNDYNDTIERGFEVFSDIAKELKEENNELYIEGFLFKEVLYPEVFVIDN